MAGKTTFLIVFLLLAGGLFSLHAGPERFLAQARLETDGVLQRIRAKISYSWMQSKEYFRLMVASIEETAASKVRGVQTQTAVRTGEIKRKFRESKEDLYEKTRSFCQEQSDSVSDDVAEKTARVKEEIREMGKQYYEDASREVGRTVDNFRK